MSKRRGMVARRLVDAFYKEFTKECAYCHEMCATKQSDWDDFVQGGGDVQMMCFECYTERVNNGMFRHELTAMESTLETVSEHTGIPVDVLRQMAESTFDMVEKKSVRNLN